MRLLASIIFVTVCFNVSIAGEDFYELLGITKDADSREIRKAFKKLAVTLHPDKNQDDEDAHEKFIKLTRAYEVLKDEDLRKKYDLHGEDGLPGANRQQPRYHSYTYYRDNFGIYDDDQEIITLTRTDFQQSVLNSNSLWFINFYSPMCSHCHTLAPIWRALAKEMEGVLRFGAVNCEDEWQLCRSLAIRSYPSLLMYPSRWKYEEDRTLPELRKFVLSKLKSNIIHIQKYQWMDLLKSNTNSGLSWLLFLCGGRQFEECPSSETRLKVGSILDGLTGLASIDCDAEEEWCSTMGPSRANVIFWKREGGMHSVEGQYHEILSHDAQDITKSIFDLLPHPTDLDEEAFQEIQSQLSHDSATAWLVYFYLGSPDEQSKELKKLPSLLPTLRIGRVHCGRHSGLCRKWQVHRYPMFAVLKPGGKFEVYHGRDSAHDVANFAKESSAAPNLHTLSAQEFPDVLHKVDSNKSAWFIDFYAPWCPPCMQLLPELREASKHFEDSVNFGTIDCTVHSSLCHRYNIHAYPTTMFFNKSESELFRGSHTALEIVQFIEEMLSPSGTKLSEIDFYEKIGGKSPDELYVVDFYAPWCGPCQELAPQWRKLAKMVADVPNVNIAQVDCVAERQLCAKQGVRSYPTIRLYPFGSQGLSAVAIYSDYNREAWALRTWLYSFIPSSVVELSGDLFDRRVLNSKEPWLIDFYTPWCGACRYFDPEFRLIAQKLEGRVNTGKVNCDDHRDLCSRAYVHSYPTVAFYYPMTMYPDQGETLSNLKSDQILATVERVLVSLGTDPHDDYHDEL